MPKSVLMIIAPEQFRDEELNVPRERFAREGWQVDVASTRTGDVQGMLGAIEPVTRRVDDVSPDAYDAVVVVGGMGSIEHLWQNARVHQILQTLARANKVVAGICLSGAVLANAGVLTGKRATVWETPESKAALEAGGATYTAEPCTQDGNLITANGPDAASAFAEAIVARVQSLATV